MLPLVEELSNSVPETTQFVMMTESHEGLEAQAKRHPSERNGASRTSSAVTSPHTYDVNPFGFEGRTSFDATKNLLGSRSENFIHRPPPVDDDIWKRPPPDFRPQNFAPKPPKRNSRDAMQPWKYGTIPGQKEVIRREEDVKLPHILQPKLPEEPSFETRFSIQDPFEARVSFAKYGMYKPEMYQMPKPHDFRGYPPIKSQGLPEFETNYERDPYNIHFNSERLNQIHGINRNPPSERDIRGRQMAPPLFQPPNWEARLILPPTRWPEKYNAYTRYRRSNRSPHSALMDRIDTTLGVQWAKDKLERQLRKSAGAVE